MGYRYYNMNEKRLQRKLIPLNLFVAVLSLVAAISLMFTPFLTIDFTKIDDSMKSVYGENYAEELGGESDMDFSSMLGELPEGMELKITFSPMGMAKVAFADDGEKAQVLIGELFDIEAMFDAMIVPMINSFVIDGFELAGEEAPDLTELNAALRAFDSAKNSTEFTQAVNTYIEKLEPIVGEISSETKDEILKSFGDMYDETVEKVGAGNFSLESMSCVMLGKMLEEEGIEAEFTNYTELFFGFLNGTITLPGESNPFESMGEIMTTLNEYAGYFGYVFYVFAGFAGLWAILFLFSFFHTFAKNKRFTMWYVKLLGCYPAILCFLLPIVGKLVFVKMSADMAMIAVFLGLCSSMTWISGLCYLLLWAVSIFWAFPIKRKIRKLRG